MPESLTAPARDALAAAVELADLLHANEPDDWADERDAVLAILRRIDRGGPILAAILDAHRAAAPPS